MKNERDKVTEGFVCCGKHAVCEREDYMQNPIEVAEYFDDEELDRFRGRDADAYTSAEEDEFREVLYTMFPGEVEDWLHSLELRGVALPACVREEALLIVREHRFGV